MQGSLQETQKQEKWEIFYEESFVATVKGVKNVVVE